MPVKLDKPMSTLLSAQSVGYDNTFGPLLTDVSFSLKKGDRIGLIGHNGCGKSTLLKILSGDLSATRGSVTSASQCLMARVQQSLPDTLHHRPLVDAVLTNLPHCTLPVERWQEGKEQLAQTLKNFSGAVILVSHDRTLIEKSCNRFWLIDNQRLEQWQDLAPVCAILAASSPPAAVTRKQHTASAISNEQCEQEHLLSSLLELESKLADDLARKPKHQKPELQYQWRQQIDRINALLDLA